MTWGIAQFSCLFLAAWSLQLAAIAIRHIFASLFFSFLHSVLVSAILYAMGNLWLALAHLWLSSAISYLALIQTSILLGSQKVKRFRRRITISLFIYIISISILFYLSTHLMPSDYKIDTIPGYAKSENIATVLVERHGLSVLVLALLALSTLVSVYLLIRRDDVLTRKES